MGDFRSTTTFRTRFKRACRPPLLAFVIVVAAMAPAAAQEHMRVDGTVQSISGQRLTLLTDTPISRGRSMFGLSLVPPPSATSPGLYVDLRELTEREYGSIRPGDRISLTGVVSDDSLIATSITTTAITRGTGQQSP